jgi:NAD(P)-dependent dehydrogenase (short-subunit alcohol dehydrogenase family)
MTSPVAAVTGAAQGIGERIAEVLAAEGYQLALFDRQPLDKFEQWLRFTGDVRSETDVAAFAGEVSERYGRIDVLVNNAGIACISPAEETPASLWREVIDVNLTGPFLLSQAFGRQMLADGGGSIINIASVAGLFGVADRAAYNARLDRDDQDAGGGVGWPRGTGQRDLSRLGQNADGRTVAGARCLRRHGHYRPCADGTVRPA